MRTFSVYPQPTIEPRVVDLLLGSANHKGGEIWLVSPWISDFDIRLGQRGFFLPQLGTERDSIRFSELLTLCGRGNRVSVVMRPPHVLIGRGDLARIVHLISIRTQLAAGETTQAVTAALALMEEETERLVSSALSQSGTAEFACALLGAPNLGLYFNARLHAKLLVTPVGALVGSANMTRSGMNSNDELMLEVNDSDSLNDLRTAAGQMASRPFATDLAHYTFSEELDAEERAALNQLLSEPSTPARLASFLRTCLRFA